MPSPAASVATRIEHVRVLRERLLRLRGAPRGPCRRGSSTTASGRPSSVRMRSVEVVERVAVLGEDDQLPPLPVASNISASLSWSSSRELVPLRVGARAPHAAAASSSRPRSVSISASSSAIVCAADAWSTTCSSSVLELGVRRVVEVVEVLGGSAGSPASRSMPTSPPRCSELLLAQPRLEPLAAAPQRLVDRLGRRRQPALQDRSARTRRRCPGGPRPRLERVGAVHLLAHVLGDLARRARASAVESG